MGEVGFFDEVAAVGNEILDVVGGSTGASDPATTTFLLRIRDVYLQLIAIHDDIANATVDVGEAESLDDAKHILKSLHHDALESVFRARRWCDELEALGHDLQRIPANIAITDRSTWDDFTNRLRQREGEVAWLYEEAMYNVISRAESATSLDELQSYVRGVSDELITQKARFDLLAKRAAALARRR